jgi:hypothetical protein
LAGLFFLTGLDLQSSVLHRDGFAFFFQRNTQILGEFRFGLQFEKVCFGVLGGDVEIFAGVFDHFG